MKLHQIITPGMALGDIYKIRYDTLPHLMNLGSGFYAELVSERGHSLTWAIKRMMDGDDDKIYAKVDLSTERASNRDGWDENLCIHSPNIKWHPTKNYVTVAPGDAAIPADVLIKGFKTLLARFNFL